MANKDASKRTDEGGVEMTCNFCGQSRTYSPLRLGRQCGECHRGKWIPQVAHRQVAAAKAQKDQYPQSDSPAIATLEGETEGGMVE